MSSRLRNPVTGATEPPGERILDGRVADVAVRADQQLAAGQQTPARAQAFVHRPAVGQVAVRHARPEQRMLPRHRVPDVEAAHHPREPPRGGGQPEHLGRRGAQWREIRVPGARPVAGQPLHLGVEQDPRGDPMAFAVIAVQQAGRGRSADRRGEFPAQFDRVAVDGGQPGPDLFPGDRIGPVLGATAEREPPRPFPERGLPGPARGCAPTVRRSAARR